MVYICSTDQFELTIVQVFSSHMWQMATAFDSTGLDDGGRPGNIKYTGSTLSCLYTGCMWMMNGDKREI